MKLARFLVNVTKIGALTISFGVIGVAPYVAKTDFSDPRWHWQNQFTDKSKWPYDYKDTCYFNKSRRRCTVLNTRGRYTISKNNHVEILWEDGDITLFRLLERPQKGARVLINNSTPGVIQSASYMNDVLSFRIKSSSGNTLRFQTSD